MTASHQSWAADEHDVNSRALQRYATTLRQMKYRLFDPNGDHGTVILNWTGDVVYEFDRMARAFHATAREAADRLKQNSAIGVDGWPPHDFLAYPVAFLYRHALELHMKAVILAGAPVFEFRGLAAVDRASLLKEHSLEFLRSDFERVFETFRWNWDFGVPDLRTIDDFRELLREFQTVDARSFAFRYPITTKGEAALPRGFRMNVFAFADVLDPVLFALGGLPGAADDALQAMYEARAETYE